MLKVRVEDGSWQELLPGECVALAGSRSLFVADLIDAELRRRVLEFDVHPTGPLPGRAVRGAAPQRACAELEDGILASLAPLIAALEAQGVEAARRPLRVRPEALSIEWEAADCCVLHFTLPAGAYATTLLGEIFLLETQMPRPQTEAQQDQCEDPATGEQ